MFSFLDIVTFLILHFVSKQGSIKQRVGSEPDVLSGHRSKLLKNLNIFDKLKYIM